jgi:hypothetical protein
MGSSTIFRGTVLEMTLIPNIQTVRRPDGTQVQLIGNGTYKVRLLVAETFSGKPEAEQIVYTAQQSSACGFPFQAGKEYVVFTYRDKDQLWTGRCSRTALLQPGTENEAVAWMREYAAAPHGSWIYGSLRMPQDSELKTVPVKIQLEGPENRQVQTDPEGKYLVRSLKAGDYVLTANAPNGFSAGPARKISVSDKGCVVVDWPVTYEGRIRGRVLDVDGRPVADLEMLLKSANGARLHDYPKTTTDGTGAYEYDHLSPGQYLVLANRVPALTEERAAEIYYPHSQASDAGIVSLGPAETVDRVDFVLARLRPTDAVKVSVVLQDGRPAPAGLLLFAFPNGVRPNQQLTRTGLTDASGTAILPLKFGQEYAISVARDRQHPFCGFIQLTFSEQKTTGVLTIDHPDECLP